MKEILKSVSRSFYLTMRFLPRPMREPVSLAYLLARATDTIADTNGLAPELRLTTLRELARVIAGEENFAPLEERLRDFAGHQTLPNERRLIENLREPFAALEKMEAADREDIRAVLQTIVRGQMLDLERFGDGKTTVALRSASELDEYTFLVAGCVGEFWTEVGFRRLPPFATRAPNEMIRLGIEYGKGLQMINILRDRPADRANGREYLPADELAEAPAEEVALRWRRRAKQQIGAGLSYCESLTNWRVRFATALPALIGARTISLLRAAGNSKEKVKVPRKEMRRILLGGFLASFSSLALRTLFNRLLAPPR